jgi:hypothetical protein
MFEILLCNKSKLIYYFIFRIKFIEPGLIYITIYNYNKLKFNINLCVTRYNFGNLYNIRYFGFIYNAAPIICTISDCTFDFIALNENLVLLLS